VRVLPLPCQRTPTCLPHSHPRRWVQDLATWRSKLVALLQHVGPAGQKVLQAPARQLLSSDVLVAHFADLPEEVKVLVFQVGGVLGGVVGCCGAGRWWLASVLVGVAAVCAHGSNLLLQPAGHCHWWAWLVMLPPPPPNKTSSCTMH
jgi:hypothetical protein